jgi:streptogrisin C
METGCELFSYNNRIAEWQRSISRRAEARLRSAPRVALIFVFALLVPFTHATAQPEDVATELHPAALDALARDLGLSPQQAHDRIMAEGMAQRILPTLRQALGTAYAGSWFDPTDLKLVVATTDEQTTAAIETNGARSAVVKWNLEQLNNVRQRLDQGALQLSDQQKRPIWKWGVDVKTNSVMITIPADDPEALIAAQDFITLSRVDANVIRIEQSKEGPPTLFQSYVVRGGDQYSNTTDGSLCSVGFSVDGGYVTAGHCSEGTTGDVVTGYNGAQQGTFVGSEFPTEDRAWVQVNGSWAPSPCVGDGADRDCGATDNVVVSGSTEVGVGATVCRWGRTTGGPHCGEIQNTDVTVVLGGVDTVYHLTQTSACGEPGDSGGPYMWNHEAQGTLTGGSGNCSSGGTTYFYPLNLTLNHFNLTLLTAEPPPPPWTRLTNDIPYVLPEHQSTYQCQADYDPYTYAYTEWCTLISTGATVSFEQNNFGQWYQWTATGYRIVGSAPNDLEVETGLYGIPP